MHEACLSPLEELVYREVTQGTCRFHLNAVSKRIEMKKRRWGVYFYAVLSFRIHIFEYLIREA